MPDFPAGGNTPVNHLGNRSEYVSRGQSIPVKSDPTGLFGVTGHHKHGRDCPRPLAQEVTPLSSLRGVGNYPVLLSSAHRNGSKVGDGKLSAGEGFAEVCTLSRPRPQPS